MVSFFSCNHGKTRRVRNVNIELPQKTSSDGLEISAATVNFLLHQTLSKQIWNESQISLI